MSEVDVARSASVQRIVGAVGLIGTVLLFVSVILGSPDAARARGQHL